MTFPNPIQQSLRIALVSFLVGCALLAGWQKLSAQTIASHDSNAPVNYAADRIELQERQDRVVLSGNVDITQADLRLRAARTTVAYTREGSLKIQRIDATGGVLVTRGNESAHGDVAIYDFNRRIITMVGNVRLQKGGDTLNGGRMVIDLNSGVSSVDGSAAGSTSASGRVSGSFAAPKQN
ncbi:MAG: LptA/OstA family protein [Novosphingobium sp.]|nr:OstA family protein [Novosphingobium sp.]